MTPKNKETFKNKKLSSVKPHKFISARQTKTFQKKEDLYIKTESSPYCSTGVSPTNDVIFKNDEEHENIEDSLIKEIQPLEIPEWGYLGEKPISSYKKTLLIDEDNLKELDLLNNELDMVKADSFSIAAPKDPNNLLNERNMLRRETFIDNNFNVKATKAKNSEIFKESDGRLKKYEILLSFINKNLDQINNMMHTNNILPQDSFHNRIEKNTLEKIEEELSSLKSSFRQVSKEAPSSGNLNYMAMKFDITPRDSINKLINNDLTKSVLVSSSYSSIYRTFFGEIDLPIRSPSFNEDFSSLIGEDYIESLFQSNIN